MLSRVEHEKSFITLRGGGGGGGGERCPNAQKHFMIKAY